MTVPEKKVWVSPPNLVFINNSYENDKDGSQIKRNFQVLILSCFLVQILILIYICEITQTLICLSTWVLTFHMRALVTPMSIILFWVAIFRTFFFITIFYFNAIVYHLTLPLHLPYMHSWISSTERGLLLILITGNTQVFRTVPDRANIYWMNRWILNAIAYSHRTLTNVVNKTVSL